MKTIVFLRFGLKSASGLKLSSRTMKGSVIEIRKKRVEKWNTIYERTVRMKLQWKSRLAGQIGDKTFRGFESDINMKRTPIPIPTIVA